MTTSQSIGINTMAEKRRFYNTDSYKGMTKKTFFEAVKALVDVLKSDAIKQYIKDTYDGAVVAFN